MTDTILADMQLSSAMSSRVINCPFEKVDVAMWLFGLSEDEFRRCCPSDHISCGSTVTDEGKPMLLNVEMIGHALMVQRYLAEIETPALCKMVSVSEAFTPNGPTRVQVIWTLGVKRIDEKTCELLNCMTVHPTAEFMEFLAQHKIKFKDAAGARQHVEGEHNRRETPLIAASIERMALGQGTQRNRSTGAAQCYSNTNGRTSGTAERESKP
jgi:hypothetical protein